VVVRLLAKAHQRGRLTDRSYQLLRDLIDGTLNFPPLLTPTNNQSIQTMQDWIATSGVDIVDEECCLDDLNESDSSDTLGDTLVADPRTNDRLESDMVWQEEAYTRERQYKHGHLGSYGLRAGIDSRSPFEAPYQQHQAEQNRPRELKAIKSSWHDLDMPGFVESFLRKYEVAIGTSGNIREAAVQTKYSAVRLCSAVRAQERGGKQLPQRGPPPDDLISRQLAYIVNSSGAPPAVRRSDCGQLYRRLARALDQRAPPDQRLFTHDDDPDDTTHVSHASQVIPLWMRGSVSRHMFGSGSDIFISVNETRLADYDPYQT